MGNKEKTNNKQCNKPGKECNANTKISKAKKYI